MKKIQLLALFLLLNGAAFSQAYFQYLKKGEKHFNNKEYNLAIAELTKVIDLKGDHFKSLNYRGLSYEAIQKLDEALVDFKKATEVRSKEAVYHENLGRVYFKLEKYEEAIASLTIAIDRDKKSLTAYATKVYAHIAIKQFPAAVETAKLAVIREKNKDTYYNLGVAQDSLMQFSDAVNSFSRAKFYSSKMINAYIGLAYSTMKLNDFKKALEYADKSIELDPENVSALLVRADIHAKNRSHQYAVNDISRVISYQPNEFKYRLLCLLPKSAVI